MRKHRQPQRNVGGFNWRRPLSERTRKLIFVLIKENGLEELRHEVQFAATGKRSLREFTENDGWKLVKHLQSKVRSPKPKVGKEKTTASPQRAQRETKRKKFTRSDGIIQLYTRPTATRGQIKKCFAIMYEIIERERQQRKEEKETEKYSDDAGARLHGWARKITKEEAQTINELMQAEANDLIELLKTKQRELRATANERQ